MSAKTNTEAKKQEVARRKELAEAEVNRNQLISRAWNAWLASEEGQKCLSEGAYGEYLRNRLWRAFIAGALWTNLNPPR